VGSLRIEHFAKHGSLSDISVSEQFDAVSRQLTDRTPDSKEQSIAASRLDYVVPAAFAMNQYESGFKLDIIQNSAFALIPRFLWPDKPILTTGNEVNYRMGFQSENNIGVTVLADIYWNLGWLGLVLLFMIGVYNGFITIYSRELMRGEDWFMLPFVMAAFRLGVSLDGEFVASIFVPAVINLVILLGLRAVSSAPTASEGSAQGCRGRGKALSFRGRRRAIELAPDNLEVAGVRAEQEVGDRADPRDQAEQEIDSDITRHAAHLPFRQAEVARFPDHVAAERGADDVAGDGNEVEDDVEPDLAVGPGDGEQAFEQMLERLDALADRFGVAGGVKAADGCGQGHWDYLSLAAFRPR
jgi:hypothetical protein